MKKAVLVFTKVPKVGEVKTRLTESRGGILTPEEAQNFYEACLLDVLDVCLSMKKVDVWICYNKDGERSYLDTLLAQVSYPQRIAGVFPDQGGSFNSCMQYAADFLLKPGKDERLADALVILGGDIPTLQPAVLQKALDTLQLLSCSNEGQKFATKKSQNSESWVGAAVVEGACQEGGFSLIGLTCTTPFTFQEVFYNMEGITALDMLVDKVKAKNIPFGTIEMLPDVDIPVDLASLIPMLKALELAGKNNEDIIVPKRTLKFFQDTGIQSQTLPPEREAI